MKHWQDKCALFGLFNNREASLLTYFGLYAQQHRGQEGAGILSLFQKKHLSKKGLGLVGDIFNKSSLKKLKGRAAIGHTRYSTKGKSQDKKNLQPMTIQTSKGPLSLAHNGQIVNFKQIKKTLKKKGLTFKGTSDSECLLRLIASEASASSDFILALKKALSQVEGAYSLLILTEKELIAVRDPRGFRPLVLGKKDKSFILASETCAFDLIEAEYLREIKPGEIFVLSKNKQQSFFLDQKEERKACIFEHVYFARPDSVVFGRLVYQSRKEMGRKLAQQAPAPSADFVIPVPDSGVASALGYAQESGIPFEMGIIRNHYVGRTFIHPTPSVRDFRVKIKLNPQKNLIKNKDLVVVDDSLVRGTTSRMIVKILRQLGVRKIHFRVASPPVIGPCLYGVDTPNKSQLISAQKNLEEIKNFLKVDSLEFLSVKNLKHSVEASQNKSYCQACFTGKYPTKVFL